MDGTLLVLRTDLVVYAPPAPIHGDVARHFRDAFEEATDNTVRIVVLDGPAQVVDLRDADPELDALAERIATRLQREAIPEAAV